MYGVKVPTAKVVHSLLGTLSSKHILNLSDPTMRALTPRVPPARHPAVVSRLEAGLLARQAGVADEVGRHDVRAGFHQGDVVIQLAVRRVAEVLVAVDALDGDHSLWDLGALELMLPQDDAPAAGVLGFTSGR